jgi:hypothetical protein
MPVTINGSGQLPVQVVQAFKTDTFSAATAAYVDITGLSVNITPTSASNRVLIFATLNWAASANDLNAARLLRGATVIAAGDAAGSRTSCFAGMRTASADNIVTDSIVFLDSPATTSTVTYKIQAKSGDTNTFFVNRTSNDSNAFPFPRASSSIIVMEISG